MTLNDIIKEGPLKYRHHYLQTMVGNEVAHYILECPHMLKTLAKNHPEAELPHATERIAESLPHEIWQYCNLAMGRDGDTAARRH